MRQFTFELHDNVERKEVRFTNRYGIELAGDIYLPKPPASQKLPALVIGGAFGAVKEQASGFYANQMASRGFVTLAFDPSFIGESGGPRNVASGDIHTEDIMSAVDRLGQEPLVDRKRIGAIGICGWGSLFINATSLDTRIKALATISMFDNHQYMKDMDQTALEDLAEQRWQDVDSGIPAKLPRRFGEHLPEGSHPDEADTFDYYKKRGYHPNSRLSEDNWLAIMPYGFINTPLINRIDKISPRPLLMIAGEKARLRGMTESAFEQAKEPKELIIVSDAYHCTLYDDLEKIPFDRFEVFFKENLKHKIS